MYPPPTWISPPGPQGKESYGKGDGVGAGGSRP